MAPQPQAGPPQTVSELISAKAAEIEALQTGENITEGVHQLLMSHLGPAGLTPRIRTYTEWRMDLDGYLIRCEVSDELGTWEDSALIPEEAIVRNTVSPALWAMYMRNWVRTELLPKIVEFPPLIRAAEEIKRGPAFGGFSGSLTSVNRSFETLGATLDGANIAANEFSQMSLRYSEKAGRLAKEFDQKEIVDQLEVDAAIESIKQVLRESPDPETP